MEIRQFIEENIDAMKQDLKKLVSYNSVYSEDEKPFGKMNRAVLDCALGLMEEKGLRTENVDYYCGFGETGEGEKLIGILAHLDVVPAGEGWKHDPFDMTEEDGYLYGRGVSDDKGAAIASMYALKYLIQENYPFQKRVRLILGCNEETGSRCIRHYVEKYGHIDCGFTPDGNFPGIYAEKGMVAAKLVGHDSRIIDIRGGEASNVVNKKITCSLPLDRFDENLFKQYLMDHKLAFDYAKGETIDVTVYGESAHASMPDLGKNAFSHLMEALYHAGFEDTFVSWFHKYFSLEVHGEKLGYESLKDDISDTTINFGIIGKQDNDIIVSLDMRFPVKTDSGKVVELLNIGDEHNELVIMSRTEPLYFDIDSPMIKALKKAYVDVTGDDKTPMEAIGGGTYAKAIHNCIAFGCEFQGENNHIHDLDECLNIDNFKKQVELYVAAIRNLNEIG